MELLDLFGQQGVPDPERVAVEVLQRDHDLALVRAAQVAPDEVDGILRSEIGEGNARQEVMVVGLHIEPVSKVRHRAGQLAVPQLTGA